MDFQRSSCLFLHPTSLPSSTGVGNFGKSAYQFVDLLKECGFGYWQVCPLGPTGYGDSPYQSFSSFAGNPYLIDIEGLASAGLCSEADLAGLNSLSSQYVDYGRLYDIFWPVLAQIHKNYLKDENLSRIDKSFLEYEVFTKKMALWLEPYSLFQAIKSHCGGRSWIDWPEKYRSYQSVKNQNLPQKIIQDQEAQKFFQFLFFTQWKKLKEYANENGIEIIGDLPIFVAHDSCDVWAYPHLFDLDQSGNPNTMAGVPPDYFSETGQLWGNPLYKWAVHEKDGYDWWIQRIRSSLELYDVLRLDHFRGFDSFWAVPQGSKDARPGKWKKGPGGKFFKKVQKVIPGAPFIAENLGEITDSAQTLLEETGFPGITVLQFGFGSGAKNLHLPHNYKRNAVAYTSTHDNDTTKGWYEKLPLEVQDHVRCYLRVDGRNISWDLIRSVYASSASIAITTVPDLLASGSEARLNLPGSSEGNWSWRMSYSAMKKIRSESAGYLKELAQLYGRA